MNFSSDLSNSEEYQSFRSSVSLRKLTVDSDPTKIWKFYDAGPRSIMTPLVCLPPVSATADIFYKQILYLTARGIRVISVEGPIYWSVADWCEGFKRLLDHFGFEKVHIFGSSLGGFLALKFTEYTLQYPRVASLILCNAFLDTSIFNYNETATLFWILPGPVLKKLVMGNIRSYETTDLNVAESIEFVIERLDTLSQQELASRLTLNCINCKVDASKIEQLKITIIDVFGEAALSNQAREDFKCHLTNAKLAHLKSGGNFPYLSHADEVNMHILIHLRMFSQSKFAAQKLDNSHADDINSNNNILVEDVCENGTEVTEDDTTNKEL